MISVAFFVWFLFAFLWTVNALRRPVPPGKTFPPLWLPGMLISELAPLYLVLRAVVALGFISLGAAESTLGQTAMALFVLSETGLLILMGRTIVSARQTDSGTSPWTIWKVTERRPPAMETTEEIPYGNGFTLDYHGPPGADLAPALIYVHPGSWMRGRPGRQARALFHRLTMLGWVVLDIRYPLSPAATFPDHLIGVKRAIAWARDGGRKYGVDPERIVISGGSSGAHLAALAALTWDRSDLQPGFESADTSVMACMPFYGIYDLLVRNPTRYDWPFVARYVMKARSHEAPALYQLGSPVDQVREDAPPFYVVHGEFDSIVLPFESRHFVEALTNTGATVTYREIRGAQHGFDAVASLRSRAVADMCAAWLNGLVAKPPANSG